MAPTRILVVEDHATVAKDIESRLTRLGYIVADIVTSGNTALQRVAETRPDVVLIDIQLGDYAEGVEAAEKLHTRFDIPVVYLTALVNDEVLERAQIAQPFGLVSKPFETHELHAAIEMALYTHRLQNRLKESNTTLQALQTSEERYRNQFQNMLIGFYRATPQGQFLEVNPALVHMLGFQDQASLMATNATDLYVDPRARQAWLNLLQEENVVHGFEVQLHRHDGTVIWVKDYARAVRDDSGHIIYNEGSLEDITEWVRAEQALQRHASRLETLHEINLAVLAGQSSEAIAQVALRHIHQLLPCDRASVVLFDYEAGHARVLTSHSTGESAGPGSRLPLESFNVSAILSERGPVTIDDMLNYDSPSPVMQKIRAEGLRSVIIVPLAVQNHLIGSLNIAAHSPDAYSPEDAEIVRQVTDHLAIAIEQTQLREELQLHMQNLEALVRERTTDLQAALERVQSADRLKSEFVSNVSHELRTPLTNIKLYLTLLTRGKREKLYAYLETLRRETDRLQELIESILDLSRLDLGRTRAILEPTDLNLLMGTLVADRAALVTDRGLGLDVEPSAQLPLALADARLVEQVLTNLLTNALNYTPAGGQIRLYTGCVEAEGQRWITVSVADTGPGIPEKERPQLYERFYRGSAGRASDAPGTGLGLAICKEIMDRHGGRITLDSEVGQGSTFTIWLRVAQAMP